MANPFGALKKRRVYKPKQFGPTARQISARRRNATKAHTCRVGVKQRRMPRMPRGRA